MGQPSAGGKRVEWCQLPAKHIGRKKVVSTRRASVCCLVAGGFAAALGATVAASGEFPAENISLLSHLSLADLGADSAYDCWGYVSESGREYAIIGLSTGTGFVEITDPGNPLITGIVLTPNLGQDMKVFQNYVYSASDSGPGHVIDVSDIDNGVITLVDSTDGGAHNLAINEESGFLYACIGGPMVVLDLTDPVLPELAGVWDGETHDAQVVTYTEGPYAGREIAFVFAGWSGRIDIVDVTDKQNMFLVDFVTYPGATYTHEGWLSGDRRHLYVSDEVDEIPRTTIIDVSDLENPFFVSDFTTGLSSTDHNLYVRDGFVFEANYSSGLRVFNACDPLNPVEVGYFDTFPAHNGSGYEGAWSNYPFFPSGTVIVSDRVGGLFVLDVTQAIGAGCCPADLDGDGTVGIIDFLMLLAAWGPCPEPCPPSCAGDLDGDCTVGITDFLELLANWGPCP